MRIVSLLSSATEWLFALGLGQQVQAVSHECKYPPEVQQLRKATHPLVDSSLPSGQIDEQVKTLSAAGGPLYRLDSELICSLQPDVIVTQAQCDVCAVRYADVLELVRSWAELRQTRVDALQPTTLGEILQDVVRLGQACHVPDAAQALYESLIRRRLAVIEDAKRLASEHRPRVAVIEWTDPIMLAGNWTPDLIHDAGGQSVLAQAGKRSEYAAWADVVAARPEVIVVAPCGFGLARSTTEAARLTQLPGWSELPAVRGGRTFVVDGDAYFNNSGPRILDSLELLSWMIHPEYIPSPTSHLAEGLAWQRL
jgi:iron complex transport system substrate-binding protein